MSKLDQFVSVRYSRTLSSFSSVDYDTVVIISNTKVGEDADSKVVCSSNGIPIKPVRFSAASAIPETIIGDLRTVAVRCLEHGRRVMFWNEPVKNQYCYLFADFVSGAPEWQTKWRVCDGFEQFMAVFPRDLYEEVPAPSNEKDSENDCGDDCDCDDYTIEPATKSAAKQLKYKSTMFDGTAMAGNRIVICGHSLSGKNATELSASVAGVIAGGYRNFTTHLRQIMPITEMRQAQNPSKNPDQARYIGSVTLAGNSFIEGSMTYGDSEGENIVNRKFIDRQVLEDRLRSRIQEECLRVMTAGDGVPFTESGANLIAGAGAIALSEAAGLNIIDDFDTEVNYGDVTLQDIENRHYKTLVYRFRFAGSIEFVELVLEV